MRQIEQATQGFGDLLKDKFAQRVAQSAFEDLLKSESCEELGAWVESLCSTGRH